MFFTTGLVSDYEELGVLFIPPSPYSGTLNDMRFLPVESMLEVLRVLSMDFLFGGEFPKLALWSGLRSSLCLTPS